MGGVLSEYNMGISPQKGLFPMRNRIISGLSDGIFVTEAGARSGSLMLIKDWNKEKIFLHFREELRIV